MVCTANLIAVALLLVSPPLSFARVCVSRRRERARSVSERETPLPVSESKRKGAKIRGNIYAKPIAGTFSGDTPGCPASGVQERWVSRCCAEPTAHCATVKNQEHTESASGGTPTHEKRKPGDHVSTRHKNTNQSGMGVSRFVSFNKTCDKTRMCPCTD